MPSLGGLGVSSFSTSAGAPARVVFRFGLSFGFQTGSYRAFLLRSTGAGPVGSKLCLFAVSASSGLLDPRVLVLAVLWLRGRDLFVVAFRWDFTCRGDVGVVFFWFNSVFFYFGAAF